MYREATPGGGVLPDTACAGGAPLPVARTATGVGPPSLPLKNKGHMTDGVAGDVTRFCESADQPFIFSM